MGFVRASANGRPSVRNIPREVCEEALAHVNPNRVEAAYQRSDLFEKRRELMERWAQYLNPEPASVVSLDVRAR